ncbi:MAG: hypothetical protein KKC05_00810, partial [Nanoarchaeota archaeon]|nr:hypothetical protein [Nanoarchaeota archaeon]
MTTSVNLWLPEYKIILMTSDTQWGTYDTDEKLISTECARKIYYGNSWAMAVNGSSGFDVQKLYKSLGYVPSGRHSKKFEQTIQMAIKNERFEEINRLNMDASRRGEEMRDMHSFILAVNRPEMGLYEVDEFGNVKPAKSTNDIPIKHII